MEKTEEPIVIDTENMPLGDSLSLLFSPESKNLLFVDYMFPSDTICDAYLESISTRSEEDVKRLLRKFLIPSCTLGTDKLTASQLVRYAGEDSDISSKVKSWEFFRRLAIYMLSKGEGAVQPWEGITWILDLLPGQPRYAINTLYAYIQAHAQFLPDGRLSGLSDAIAVIRAKYILSVPSEDAFSKFSPREFEHIVEALYHSMDYQTELTKESHDGGRDIVVEQTELGKRERALIECKHWSRPVGVDRIRSLLGAVMDEKASRGVIVTSSQFTKPAEKFTHENKSLELIDGNQLKVMLNEYCGTNWAIRADYLILGSKRRQTGL